MYRTYHTYRVYKSLALFICNNKFHIISQQKTDNSIV